jgi:PAS domain S-box-containing protein
LPEAFVAKLSEYVLQPLRRDDEFILYRGERRTQAQTSSSSILVLAPGSSRPSPASLEQLTREYSLRSELDPRWAVCPVAISDVHGQVTLLLEDPGGEPLDRLIKEPMETGQFLRLAIGLASALGRLHERGLIHRNLKPANILVDSSQNRVWLMGFGITSRLPRERQLPEPPEYLTGTLPYMAPEQTGRMNRSIDSRTDLYSLGVVLYEMLTGRLPFAASTAMEWILCHVAMRPVSPRNASANAPVAVASIITKLLAKTAEERYQTAAAVERDLRRSLDLWNTLHRVDDFPLGEHDIPDELLIPEKLYGRGHEIDALLASFDRVIASGRPELVLVFGEAGVGKSSVVNELHKALLPTNGLFASGKFDQYKRDIPYSSLAQAFQSLVRPLLSKSQSELDDWRNALREGLGLNGALVLDLAPDLRHVIGEQPAVQELSPRDAKARCRLVFRQFISVFARSEHPLALFLDDLQWLDAATLEFLEDLLIQPDVQHLLVIGAYRDSEVDRMHPLMRTLTAIRRAGAPVQDIALTALGREDLTQFIADAFHCDRQHASPLAHLVHDKTAGNPFFGIQFTRSLVEERLARFDHGSARWLWDLSRIHAKGYTANVVDLMVGKINRLPAPTQKALRELACLGNVASTTTLALVHGTPEDEFHAHSRDAQHLELIGRSKESYWFLHDRVQEAAYSLIPDELRPTAHLRIARLLTAHIPPEKREEAIFEIVNQFNRALELITARDERHLVAELNLIAGKRAKASTAYSSALNYLVAGAALLADDASERWHELTFALELNRAECEFLTGQLPVAEERLKVLVSRSATNVERAAVACLHMDVCTTLDQSERAIEVCLDYLRHVGIEWSPHPTNDDVRREYERMWSLIGDRSVEELIDLPLMTDAESLATVDVLTKVGPPSLFTDSNLHSMVLCRAVNLSLEHGNSDGSCVHYVGLSETAGPHFGDYEAGFRFGRLGYELVEQRGLRRFQPATYMVFGGIVLPWTKHVREGRDFVRRAFEVANQIGDLTYAGYSSHFIVTNLLTAGDALDAVQREAENSFAFAQKARFGFVTDVLSGQLGLIRTLRGLTPVFGCFDDQRFDERQFEGHLASHRGLALPACWYWIRKLQARFLAGEHVAAVEAASRAEPLLWTSPSELEAADYYFYGALSLAACCDGASTVERQQHLESLAAHHRQLAIWASNCPENFENRAALVGAEIARIDGRTLDAETLYEDAIRSAHVNGFVHNEAVAYELAGRWYDLRGFQKIAQTYLREARYLYGCWGAEGKVRQLDEHYPRLTIEQASTSPTATIRTPVEHLELATVLRVSQAVSGEIVLEQLINVLMRTAIEHAAAERGLLILPRGDALQIVAEATAKADAILVQPTDARTAAKSVPESIVQYVVRTQETVLLDDASTENAFAVDPYVRSHRARSILCLPLIHQRRLIGILYLENNLAPHVFTSSRLSVLRLLASQAAISLENTRLYADLKEGEARIRRLSDANIIGICRWSVEGDIIESNDAFLKMVGYDRDAFMFAPVRWTDMTPPEWRDGDARALAELEATGTAQPFEKELYRKDGSRVPVLVGAALFEDGEREGVAFVLDLSDQKRAEEALRSAERDLREMFETIPGFVWTMTAAGEVEVVSQQMLEYFGATLDALKDWSAFLHPDDLSRVIAYFRHTIEGGEPYDVEHRLRRADGAYRWFRARGRPLKNAEGRVVRWHNLLTDIDDRKQAEMELKRAYDSFADGQRISRTGNFTADIVADDHIWSAELYRIFEIDPATKITVQSVREIIHPEDLPSFDAGFRHSLDGADFDLIFRIITSSGNTKHVRAVARLIERVAGRPLFIGAIQDVTESKIAEKSLASALEEITRLKDRLHDENLALKEEIAQASMFEEVVGASAALKAVLSRVSKVAPTDSTVLLTGETGTGKELIARAIHKRSRRSARAFISVNCAAIPASLIASELFGHEKGAFTGASARRVGRFELAEDGTIFLDEVGELPSETQVTLLRVLQGGEFERVGGNQPIRANARVVAATNRDLDAAIATGAFRSDLFYRLNVFPIEVPPLRDRKEDIPLLVDYFIARFARKAGKRIRGISKKTLDLLLSYPWPGNIRELQNVVERSVVVCETETFSVDESWLSRQPGAPQPKTRLDLGQLAAHEREIIEAALRESVGRVAGPSGAAAKLGIPSSTLESKIRSLRINKNLFKP